MSQVVTRFAPSPTGYLHLGNLRACLFSFLFAKSANGKFVLRIDDTDKKRSKLEYVEGIKADLNWLGIVPDEIIFQSQRAEIHLAFAEKLKQTGALYECFEESEALQKTHQNEKASYWRFRLPDCDISWEDMIRGPQKINTKNFNDPVLIRTIGEATYTLASVADDIDMGITHIIRGEDHISNTAVQISILQAVDNCSLRFAHLPYLLDKDGNSLSKRIESLSIKNMRENGILPNAINSFAFSLGLSETKCMTMEQMIEKFSIYQYNTSMPKIVNDNLLKINKNVLGQLSYSEFQKLWRAFALNPLDITEDLWLLIKENITTLQDVTPWHDIFQNNYLNNLDNAIQEIKACYGTKSFIIFQKIIEKLQSIAKNCQETPVLDEKTLSDMLQDVQNLTNIKGKNFFMPLRLALTGVNHGNHLKEVMSFLGYTKILNRLQNIMEKID